MRHSWVRQIATVILVATCLNLCGRSSAAPSYSLQTEWRVELGQGQRAIYRLAVCPDGSVYFTNGDGRLALIAAGGSLIYNGRLDELAGMKAIACDARGRLHANTSLRSQSLNRAVSRLVIVQRDGADRFSATTSVALELTAFAIAATNADTVYALAPLLSTPGTQTRMLHKLSDDGRVTASFGPTTTLSGPLTDPAHGLASMAWVPEDGTLVLMLSKRYEFHFYDATGTLSRRWERNDPDFQPEVLNFATGRMDRGDQVLSAVRLPNGGFVTFVVKTHGEAPRSYLELLSASLDLIATKIPLGSDGGVLQGAAPDGGLVFGKFTPQGLSVIKARLLSQ